MISRIFVHGFVKWITRTEKEKEEQRKVGWTDRIKEEGKEGRKERTEEGWNKESKREGDRDGGREGGREKGIKNLKAGKKTNKFRKALR